MNRGTSAATSPTAHISTQMVRLVLQYTGRGPTKARTSIDSSFVLVALDDTLTRSERSLLAAGDGDLVRQQRQRLHELMRDEAVAIVESTVGRKVRAFLGDIAPGEGVAVAVFLLEPQPDGDGAETDGSAPRPAM